MCHRSNIVVWLCLVAAAISSAATAGGDPESASFPHHGAPGNIPFNPVRERLIAGSPKSSNTPIRSGEVWYGFSWHHELVPVAFSDLRNPLDGRVYSTEVSPSISVGISRSSLQFHRRGLKYHGTDDAWSLGLRYQRLKVAPELELLIDERTERPSVLKMEWSVSFQ